MTRLRARTALFLRWIAARLSGDDPVARLTEQVTALSTRLALATPRPPEELAAPAAHPSAAGTVHGAHFWTGVHACACDNPDAVDHLPPGGTW